LEICVRNLAFPSFTAQWLCRGLLSPQEGHK
jgi:hypothetical protein